MKLNDRYLIREIAGRGVLVPARVSDPSVRTDSGKLRTMRLTSSALWLLRTFEGQDFTMEQAVDAVCEHYDVEHSAAQADVLSLLDTLRSCGALEE